MIVLSCVQVPFIFLDWECKHSRLQSSFECIAVMAKSRKKSALLRSDSRLSVSHIRGGPDLSFVNRKLADAHPISLPLPWDAKGHQLGFVERLVVS